MNNSQKIPKIIRVKHDKENKYLVVSQKTINDMDLSPEALGILIRLLSNKDDWVIHVSHLMEINKLGRDKMYRILRELTDLGYAYHYCGRTNGKYDPGEWYVFETKKTPEEIQKMLPFTEKPYTAQPYTANQHLTNTNPIPSINHVTSNIEEAEAAPPGISSFFYEKLKEINPKIRKPNLPEWEKELQRLMKDGNGNSEEEIKKVINYIIATKDKPSSNGFCWATVILSPSSLRKNYAKIWAEMQRASSEKNEPETNRSIANKIIKKFPRKDIVIGHDYLEFDNGPSVNHIKFNDKEFKTKYLQEMKKRKLNGEEI